MSSNRRGPRGHWGREKSLIIEEERDKIPTKSDRPLDTSRAGYLAEGCQSAPSPGSNDYIDSDRKELWDMSVCYQCQRDPDEYDRALRRQAKNIDELRTALEEQGQQLSDQQAIHETEMAQDGRARAAMIALCRELGVAIFGDAAEGIRNEVARLRAGHKPEGFPENE